VSLTPRYQILAIFESIFSAYTKPCANLMNQGPRGDCLIKKKPRVENLMALFIYVMYRNINIKKLFINIDIKNLIN
jgi:hypothetical protein